MTQPRLLIACLLLLSGICLAQEDTTRWEATPRHFFTHDGSPATPEIRFLFEQFDTGSSAPGAFTRDDFFRLLSRPEARMIYAGIVRRYATPLSDSITKTQHESYAKVFLREKSQQAGLQFFHDHAKSLQGAETRFRVRQKDIVALLMWESGLGKYTGNYRIFNVFLGQILFLDSALSEIETGWLKNGEINPLSDPEKRRREEHRLAERKKDATISVVAMLRMSKKLKVDPLSIKGSWGGAIGYVQFLPYNLRYAVDADGDGLDLKTWPDAIYSVARYLKERGDYRDTRARRRRALMTYNASPEYAEGIMALADTLWKRHLAGE